MLGVTGSGSANVCRGVSNGLRVEDALYLYEDSSQYFFCNCLGTNGDLKCRLQGAYFSLPASSEMGCVGWIEDESDLLAGELSLELRVKGTE